MTNTDEVDEYLAALSESSAAASTNYGSASTPCYNGQRMPLP